MFFISGTCMIAVSSTKPAGGFDEYRVPGCGAALPFFYENGCLLFRLLSACFLSLTFGVRNL